MIDAVFGRKTIISAPILVHSWETSAFPLQTQQFSPPARGPALSGASQGNCADLDLQPDFSVIFHILFQPRGHVKNECYCEKQINTFRPELRHIAAQIKQHPS